MPGPEDLAALRILDAKIDALLPPRYQHCYESVPPTSMGSAALTFGPDGKVAWNEIWTSFCDLALAGGPPHRGTLLEPVPAEEVLAEPEKYQQVVEEIGRGLWLTTELPILPRFAPGWVGVVCYSEAMAVWLVRAIVGENVSARHERHMLSLPAGPQFRLAKEIKNVVTALAKTCHYWSGHMSESQRAASAVSSKAELSDTILMGPASPAEIGAAPGAYQEAVDEIRTGIQQTTGLPTVVSKALGWLGLQCSDEAMAVWLFRAVVVENVLTRREGNVLYLPVGLGETKRRLVAIVARAHQLWTVHDLLKRHARPIASDGVAL